MLQAQVGIGNAFITAVVAGGLLVQQYIPVPCGITCHAHVIFPGRLHAQLQFNENGGE